MKIIIHYQEDISKRGHFTVSTLSNLKAIIDIYPDEDITGEIRPSAKNNPELQDILKEIYNHKLAVWNKYGDILRNPPPHEKFLEVLEKNGIELNRSLKQWIGTREEYIKIPVKDPDTVYSITA